MSVPHGSEHESSFTVMRKNAFEEALFKVKFEILSISLFNANYLSVKMKDMNLIMLFKFTPKLQNGCKQSHLQQLWKK